MKMDISATTRRAYDLINAGDIDGFGDLMADGFVEHEEMPGLAPTKEGVLEMFRMYRVAFPDLQMQAEEVLVSGDKTVTRVRATGTHRGELMGMPPTGNSVDVKMIDIMQFDDAGMVREHWGVMDMFSMMQQLGAIPEGPPA
jgi:predicted ester cyclase